MTKAVPEIHCPSCGTVVDLDEAIAAEIKKSLRAERNLSGQKLRKNHFPEQSM